MGCCAGADWLDVLRSSELVQFAAAVGRPRGPLGPGTVVNTRGGLYKEKCKEKQGIFLKNVFRCC